MKEIATSLRADCDKKQMQISEGCDDICKHCPKRQGTKCEDEEDIIRLDRIFSKILGIKKNEVLSLSDAEKKKKILTFEKFQRICGHCCWFEICSEVLFSEKRKI